MTQRAHTDEWLMMHVAQGHREHLEPLIRRYASALLTFIRRMVGDRHRSEELFQEVFLAVWSKRIQYDWAKPFKPWLYAIALNKCRATNRSRRPAPQMLADEAGGAKADGPSPVDQVIATETASLVSSAVARLPHKQRAVVALRVWQALPYADIADLLGCSEATVRSHMHHGLAALRKQLEPRLQDQPMFSPGSQNRASPPHD